MNDAGVSINQAVIFSFPIFPNSTKASFTLGNTALSGAQLTLNLSSIQ